MKKRTITRLQTLRLPGTSVKSCLVHLLQVLTILLGLPLLASARVKWFVRGDSEPLVQASKFSLAEPWVQIWVGIILICITMALLMERYLPNLPGPEIHGHRTYLSAFFLRPTFLGFTIRCKEFSSESRKVSPPSARPVRS